MAKRAASDASGQSAPSEEEIDTSGWYTRAQVAAKLGVHITTVRRREDSGDLHPVFKGGVHWFDPAEVESLKGVGQDVGAAAIINASANLVKQAQEFAKESALHAERSLSSARDSHSLIATTCKSITEQMGEMVKTQQSQILQLQEGSFKMRTQVEESLNQQNDREIEREKAKAAQQIRAESLAMLKNDILPHIKNYMMTGKPLFQAGETPATAAPTPANETAPTSTPPKPIEKWPHWCDMVVSFTAEQAERVANSGAFSAEDLQRFVRVRTMVENEKPSEDGIGSALELFALLSTEQVEALARVMTNAQRMDLYGVRAFVDELKEKKDRAAANAAATDSTKAA